MTRAGTTHLSAPCAAAARKRNSHPVCLDLDPDVARLCASAFLHAAWLPLVPHVPQAPQLSDQYPDTSLPFKSRMMYRPIPTLSPIPTSLTATATAFDIIQLPEWHLWPLVGTAECT